jgi:mono/diheme cytochrome c family protein
MKSLKYLAAGLFALTALSAGAEDGAALFDKYCIACHKIQGPPQIAPPIFGVINHVKGAYPQRDAFIQRVVDWVANPDANDTLMPGAVRRFGVMPKLGYPTEDVRKIAAFLYDHRMDLPQWYVEHYRQQHGKDPVQ